MNRPGEVTQLPAVLSLIQAEAQRQESLVLALPLLNDFPAALVSAGLLLRQLAAFPPDIIRQAVFDACRCQHSRCVTGGHCGKCEAKSIQNRKEAGMKQVKELMQQRGELDQKIVVEMRRLIPAGTLLLVAAGRGKAKVRVVGHGAVGGDPTRLMVENVSTKRVTSIDGLNPGLERVEE